MSLTTDDLFILIGQKEARIKELSDNFSIAQQSNINLQEKIKALNDEVALKENDEQEENLEDDTEFT